MTLPGMMWNLLKESFGPGGVGFWLTLIMVFSFMYGIAKLIMMVMGRYKYEHQMRSCYRAACLISCFGYLFYWTYINLSTPITTLMTLIFE